MSAKSSSSDWTLEDGKNLTTILGAIVGLYLIVLARQRVKSANLQADAANEQAKAATSQIANTNKQLEFTNNQLKLAQKQVELAEKAADIDRYQKGAQMLGDGRISVRQAGVVILSELAKTNPQRFSVMCQEVLERFIIDRGQEAERENQEPEHESEEPKDQTPKQTPIFADAQSALEAAIEISTGEHGRALRLKYAYLVGANLQDANLTGAELSAANLAVARLWDANLTNAILRDANLTGARLLRANLTGADLEDANLTGADFAAAIFTDARSLTWEQLDKAKSLEVAVGLPPRPEGWSSEGDEDEDQ